MTNQANIDHYHLFVKCAKLEDFTEWNEFVENFDGMVKLRGSDFSGLKISGAKFKSAAGRGADLFEVNFSDCSLNGVNFNSAYIDESNFKNAKISGCSFLEASLHKVNFTNTKVVFTDFSSATFSFSDLREVEFLECDFYEANFLRANLEGAQFLGGKYNPLVGKEIRINLCGAKFNAAKFNSETYFDVCNFSTASDFRTLSFESANYSQGLRQTLRYCNRRHNWTDWYEKNNPMICYFVKKFWSYSDYGNSVKAIIFSFLKIALFFASIYFVIPSLIDGLDQWSPVGSLYFSIVTMTTLGFGDMHPYKGGWVAQCLIMIQVIYGYVLLGGLITVLSNLFSSDGPAQGLIRHPRPKKFSKTILVKDE